MRGAGEKDKLAYKLTVRGRTPYVQTNRKGDGHKAKAKGQLTNASSKRAGKYILGKVHVCAWL